MDDILHNHALIAGVIALLVAQLIKPFTHYWINHDWDFVQVISSGGMPSSHSSFIVATTTVIGLRQGFDSSLFALGLVVTSIVTYDASNVRWQSGLHAQRINQLVRDVFRGQPISDELLKEVIGHTPRQVYAGVLLGIIIGLLVEEIWVM